MRKMFLVLLGLLALGDCSDVQAGRRNRRACPPSTTCAPTPACCQPAPSTAAIGETQFKGGIRPLSTDCVCALYAMTGFPPGYQYYYATRCSNGQSQGLSGDFQTGDNCPVSGGPCPTGDTPPKCMSITTYKRGLTSHAHGPGTKLPAKMKHNDRLVTKNFGVFKTTDLLNGEKTLIRFEVTKASGATVPVFAKLHILQVRKEVSGLPDEHHGQYPIGQQIADPTATGSGHYDFLRVVLPDSVDVVDMNVAHVTLGNVTYEVVTLDDLK